MTGGPKTFSIVIPTYGRPDELVACLSSLTRLRYDRGLVEVIVVDDGGGVPIEEPARRAAGSLDLVLVEQPHGGAAAARNTGAARARGTYLAFTDDDCTPDPDWLTALEATLAAHPGAAVGGRTVNALPSNPYATASQLLCDYLVEYYNADPLQARFLTSNNLAMPAEAFRALGGFDTRFDRAGGEDRDICDRWIHAGHPLLYGKEAVVHHAHPLTGRGFCRQHWNYGRGALRFHRSRAARGGTSFFVEPASFYRDLVRYPFSRDSDARGPGPAALAALLVVSQAANAAGLASAAIGRLVLPASSAAAGPGSPP